MSKYRNESRVIPRFAPVEDPHWRGGNDTIKGYCEEWFHQQVHPC